MADGNVTLYPAWKQAVVDFLEAGFKAGDLVPHAWFESHFNMGHLDGDAAIPLRELRDRQFAWLANIESFKTELLEKHHIYLHSIYGKGYRWAPPYEQTGLAVETFEREAKRAYRQVGMRLTHLRIAELNDAQRRENADAIGRLSLLEGMHRSLE